MTEQERQRIDEIIASLKPSALKYETGRAKKNGMSLFHWIAKKHQKKPTGKDTRNTFKKGLPPKAQIKNDIIANPPHDQLDILFAHYQTGRYKDAEKLAISITGKFPKHQLAWKILGAVYRQTGRLKDSLAVKKKAVQFAPRDAEAHNNLGVTLREIGNLDEAEACYRQAIALKSDFVEAHYNLGNTLKELGRLDEAEASYTQAITLNPNYASAIGNRWELLFEQKRYLEALKDAELCVSKGSIERDLTTLYALGRTEEIYKRIESRSKIDSENISIAAFAAFFAESQKKRNANNFCPNPIDFISVSNLSRQIEHSDAYITNLIKELNNIETVWEPSEKSTIGGSQTVHGINIFSMPSEKISLLKSVIIKELHDYRQKFKNESCGYIQKFPPFNNLFGWHVILKHQGHQSAHIHTSGWLSGVIYLRVVPSLEKNEGAIEFSLNGQNYHAANSPSLVFQPKVGDIVFFPSSLHHKTIPFTTDTERIIVSFDLVPKPAKR